MLWLASPFLCFINCLSSTLLLDRDKGVTLDKKRRKKQTTLFNYFIIPAFCFNVFFHFICQNKLDLGSSFLPANHSTSLNWP